MPWNVVKQGKQHCVVDKTGQMIDGGCHPSKKDAVNHMRALYANVHESKELLDAFDDLLTNGLEMVTIVEKEEDGRYKIQTVSTAAVVDKEDEIFDVEAIDYDIAEAKRTGDYPEFRIFHSPLTGFGEVEKMRRVGIFAVDEGHSYTDPFSIEVCEKMLVNNTGKWRISRGFRVHEVNGGCPGCGEQLRLKEQHMVAGFRCPSCMQQHKTYRGVLKSIRYKKARTFDVSVTDVPAVPYTGATAYKEAGMTKEQLRKRLLKAGIDEDTIETRLKSVTDETLKEWDGVPFAEVLKEFVEEDEIVESDDAFEVDYATLKKEIVAETTAAVVKEMKTLLQDVEISIDDADFDVELKELPVVEELKELVVSLTEKVDDLLQERDILLKELLEETPRNGKLRILRHKEEMPKNLRKRKVDEEDEEYEEEDDEEEEEVEKELFYGPDGEQFESMSEWLRSEA